MYSLTPTVFPPEQQVPPCGPPARPGMARLLAASIATLLSTQVWASGATGDNSPAAPSLNMGGLRMGPNEMSYRTDASRYRLVARFTRSHADSRGAGLDYAALVNDRLAWGLNYTQGGERRDMVLTGLYTPMPDLDIRLSAGVLRDASEYAFYSGPDEVSVRQTGVLLATRMRMTGDSRWRDWRLQGYTVRAHDPHVAPQLMKVETGSLQQYYIDPRKLALGRLVGLSASAGLAPDSRSRLDLQIGLERLRYRHQDGSRSGDDRPVTGVRYTRDWDGCMRSHVDWARGAATDRTELGLAWHAWALRHTRTRGLGGLPDDQRWTVAYEVPIEGRRGAGCHRAPLDAPATATARLDEAIQRPAALPMVVLAKVDLTAKPELLASLDGSGLPPGTSVEVGPDSVLIRMRAPVLGIGGIDRNGTPVPNAGIGGAALVVPEGNAVRIMLAHFPPPTTAQTYTVIVPLQGGDVDLIAFDILPR